jgi:CheY-like chemotaxis protein
MHRQAIDPSGLTALVVDEADYSRALAIEQMRGAGFGRVFGANGAASAWEALLKHKPDIVLMEWIAGGVSLDLIRRVRVSQEVNCALPLLMLTVRGARAEVEAARAAGASGFLRKPISALAIAKHVRKIAAQPQPFVASAAYVGPCRRRRARQNYPGPWRRLDDVAPAAAMVAGDESVLDLKAEIARACVAAIEAALEGLFAGEPNAARSVYRAVQALADAGQQIGDPCLVLGAQELARYVRAQGATERLDPEVVRTHVAALRQLTLLPHEMADARERVSQSLKRMIDKKLTPGKAA